MGHCTLLLESVRAVMRFIGFGAYYKRHCFSQPSRHLADICTQTPAKHSVTSELNWLQKHVFQTNLCSHYYLELCFGSRAEQFATII